ncbi:MULTISPECIES: flagellar motor switch protein FliN [Thermodesulfobacterium]|jgi:flagellar motor switch protein FliN/FliY|uniref:Flagellar motor switch protein FliN n=1 Tax=Thermodesulfobacterium commune DSM 2178 TaxID=289377 RepID=A0A075WRX3_9BACT|nr:MULTISPECIES: flagellar motor switch protein FliN [Thermodesulfobacterium]AIH03780.1 flagellar motor switch protein FliN [Thermodesulfobacterium commune DSM 2178]MBZ4681686.1 flagellar motor switch protein FliN [Thermodesulfobacterium sp.]MDK2861899.1 flagellar motor switch protein FliN [Thermodesulfobacterium sp.]
MAEEEKINGQTQEETSLSPEDLMAMWEEALKEAQAGTSETQEVHGQTVSQESSQDLFQPKEPLVKEKPPTQSVSFEELSPVQREDLHPDLEFILDIPLEISVEIGRTKMLIRDLLKLNQGSIIELEKFAGEPVEVYVNGKLMAKGEVVVVNDRFGVRVTEIISAQDRIKKLGS